MIHSVVFYDVFLLVKKLAKFWKQGLNQQDTKALTLEIIVLWGIR